MMILGPQPDYEGSHGGPLAAAPTLRERRHRSLACLRIGDELGDGFGREQRVDFPHAGGARQARDGGDVPDEIEAEVFIDRCVDRVEGAVIRSVWPSAGARPGPISTYPLS